MFVPSNTHTSKRNAFLGDRYFCHRKLSHFEIQEPPLGPFTAHFPVRVLLTFKIAASIGMDVI
jgi:hypothetical protein